MRYCMHTLLHIVPLWRHHIVRPSCPALTSTHTPIFQMQCCLALACDRYDLSLSIQYKAIFEYNKPHDYETIVNHCILSQYGLNKGLEIFGTAGEDAVTKQLTQLHDRGVLDPKHPSELPAEQRHKALSYLMFLKMKRGGDTKGRSCADGRKQREYM